MGPLLSYKWSYFPLQVGLSPHLPINFWPFIRAPFYHTYNARLGAHLGLLEVQSTSQQRGGTFNSDSDWAGCLETRRSTDCQLVMVAGGVVQVTAQPSQVCGENHFQRHEGQWHRQYQSRLKLQGFSASKTQWACLVFNMGLYSGYFGGRLANGSSCQGKDWPSDACSGREPEPTQDLPSPQRPSADGHVPHLPVPYIFGTFGSQLPIHQVAIDPWFENI